MSNNSINNTIGSAANTNPLSIVKSASGEMISMGDQTDSFGYYNHAGSPEGNVTASMGSLAVDTSTGISGVYYKTTDSANTGWSLVGGIQTAFSAYIPSDLSNITGSGTVYQFGSSALTERFDIGGDFNASTGVFTAPVTGYYQFGFAVRMKNVVAANTRMINYFFINTSFAALYFEDSDAGNFFSSVGSNFPIKGSGLVALTAADTLVFIVACDGDSGDNMDTQSGSGVSSFWGYLLSS